MSVQREEAESTAGRRSDASRLETIEEALAGSGKIKLLTHTSDLLVPREVEKKSDLRHLRNRHGILNRFFFLC